MKSLRRVILPLLIAGCTLLIVGCSTSPSADDLSKLDALKQEVASLKKEVAARQTEKSNLVQQVSSKKQELDQAVQDENETRANLSNYK